MKQFMRQLKSFVRHINSPCRELDTPGHFVFVGFFVLCFITGSIHYSMTDGTDRIPFSNDGPLWVETIACAQLPQAATAIWNDSEYLGKMEMGQVIQNPTGYRFFRASPLLIVCFVSFFVSLFYGWFKRLGFFWSILRAMAFCFLPVIFAAYVVYPLAALALLDATWLAYSQALLMFTFVFGLFPFTCMTLHVGDIENPNTEIDHDPNDWVPCYTILPAFLLIFLVGDKLS